MSKHIVFATIGSLGDLHPCLALGLELKRRGHRVAIATTAFYRGKVEAAGLEFRAMRPDWDPTDPEMIGRCEEMKSGPEVLIRELILPHLRDSYVDLLQAVEGCDLLVAGEIVYAAPLVAEKLGVRWATVILSPCSFLSAHDPSLLVPAPVLLRLRGAGAGVNGAILRLGRFLIRKWWEPVRQLRREEGLRADCEPLMRDKYAPELVLAMFSAEMAEAQPDWPKQTVQAGFAFYDGAERKSDDDARLEEFLAEGEPPVVFTLGSTAVHRPGNFFAVSAGACEALGRRAVLVGEERETRGSVIGVRYASYSRLFPRAAAIVHQGGSGTTGQAMRAGKPMLFVPYGWDQPDNAARLQRRGVGLAVSRKAYAVTSAVAALRRLLGEGSFAERAAEMGCRVRAEDGLGGACGAIERMLGFAAGETASEGVEMR